MSDYTNRSDVCDVRLRYGLPCKYCINYRTTECEKRRPKDGNKNEKRERKHE